MRKGIILAVGILASALFGWCLLEASSPNRFPPCYTIKESKFRGCYVGSVSFTPSVIHWQGKEIVIKEAWLEKCQERAFHTGPLVSRLKTVSGYHLCFNLSRGWDVLGYQTKKDQPMFVVEGRGRSFRQVGTVVLSEEFETIDSFECTILCTDNWKFTNAVKIRATVKGASKAS